MKCRLLVLVVVAVVAAGCDGTVAPPVGGTTSTDGSTPTSIAPSVQPGTRSRQAMTIGGTTLNYTLVLPDEFKVGERFPILLALPPGGQGQEQVDALLDRFWEPEAKRRGWIVVSPVAPRAGLFVGPSSRLLPTLLDRIAATYPPEGGAFHLAGVSNGGLSAFRLALDNPERFLSIVVAPGYSPEESDRAKLPSLKAIPVAMWVGENDAEWRQGTERTAADLEAAGGSVIVKISPGEGHVLQKVTGEELFDALDRARRG